MPFSHNWVHIPPYQVLVLGTSILCGLVQFGVKGISMSLFHFQNWDWTEPQESKWNWIKIVQVDFYVGFPNCITVTYAFKLVDTMCSNQYLSTCRITFYYYFLMIPGGKGLCCSIYWYHTGLVITESSIASRYKSLISYYFVICNCSLLDVLHNTYKCKICSSTFFFTFFSLFG